VIPIRVLPSSPPAFSFPLFFRSEPHPRSLPGSLLFSVVSRHRVVVFASGSLSVAGILFCPLLLPTQALSRPPCYFLRAVPSPALSRRLLCFLADYEVARSYSCVPPWYQLVSLRVPLPGPVSSVEFPPLSSPSFFVEVQPTKSFPPFVCWVGFWLFVVFFLLWGGFFGCCFGGGGLSVFGLGVGCGFVSAHCYPPPHVVL